MSILGEEFNDVYGPIVPNRLLDPDNPEMICLSVKCPECEKKFRVFANVYPGEEYWVNIKSTSCNCHFCHVEDIDFSGRYDLMRSALFSVMSKDNTTEESAVLEVGITKVNS